MPDQPRELTDILRSFDEYANAAASELREGGAGFAEFAGKIRGRLIESWDTYGDGTRKMPDEKLLAEIEQEVFDLPGWAMFLWERHKDQRCVDFFVEAFTFWKDVQGMKGE